MPFTNTKAGLPRPKENQPSPPKTWKPGERHTAPLPGAASSGVQLQPSRFLGQGLAHINVAGPSGDPAGPFVDTPAGMA